MTFFYDLLDTTSEQSEAIAKVVFVGQGGLGIMLLLLFFITIPRLLKQLLCPSIQNNRL
jgi:hypothetical protein